MQERDLDRLRRRLRTKCVRGARDTWQTRICEAHSLIIGSAEGPQMTLDRCALAVRCQPRRGREEASQKDILVKPYRLQYVL